MKSCRHRRGRKKNKNLAKIIIIQKEINKEEKQK